jgi:prepilin-type N-terminal cleavage/methylation domain-containing protein
MPRERRAPRDCGRSEAMGRAGRRAFTLIELIVVTSIVVIVAATALPAFRNQSDVRLRRAAYELAHGIRYARTMAIATGRETYVKVHRNKEWWQVRIEKENGSGKQKVPNPITGGNKFRIQFGEGEYAGIVVQSASFDGGNELAFDRLGRPYRSGSSLLSDDGTVVLAAGGETKTVRVVAGTGLVIEE